VSDSPVHVLLEDYVVDLLEDLPPERDQELEGYGLPGVLQVEAVGWRDALRRALQLPEDFPIAVLDRWFRTREAAGYEARVFAAEFVAAYLKEGGRAEPEGGAKAARRRMSLNPEAARLLARLDARS
jgi:hypothetical protein